MGDRTVINWSSFGICSISLLYCARVSVHFPRNMLFIGFQFYQHAFNCIGREEEVTLDLVSPYGCRLYLRSRQGQSWKTGHPQFLIWWVWTRKILVRIKWVEALFSNNVRFFRQMTFMTFVVFKYICPFYYFNGVFSFSHFESFYNITAGN